MTDLPPDGAALFAGVLDSPRDPLPKLVLADWLDDHDQGVMAHGFRWCAAHGRHPKSRGRGGAWGGAWRDGCPPDCLPSLVARIVVSNLRNYKTPWGAFAVLADALEEIAAVVRLPRD